MCFGFVIVLRIDDNNTWLKDLHGTWKCNIQVSDLSAFDGKSEGETLMEAHSDTDVQIVRCTWV